MTITLDEIIVVSRGKLLPVVIDKIIAHFAFGQRKPKREKIKYLFETINNKELWHKVQTELILFKHDLSCPWFFMPTKERIEQFFKNLEHIINNEDSKVKHLEMDYKQYMRLFGDIDSYSFTWKGKKEAILRAITPVEKTMNLRGLDCEILHKMQTNTRD